MKLLRILLVFALVFCFAFVISACSSGDESNNESTEATKAEEITETLDGNWVEMDEGKMQLSIDGEKGLLLEDGYDPCECQIDNSAKTITIDESSWDDSRVDYQYEIIGDKLMLKTENKQAYYWELVFLKETDSTKKEVEELKEKAKYKYVGKNEHIELGEYSVGTDIKPGSYEVSFYYDDYESDENIENGEGTITFTKDGETIKTISIKDFESENVVFEDGTTVKLSSKGADSYFEIDAD